MSCLLSGVSGSVHLLAHNVLTQLFASCIAGTLPIVLLPLYCILYAVCRGCKEGIEISQLSCRRCSAKFLEQECSPRGEQTGQPVSELHQQDKQSSPPAVSWDPSAAFTRSPVLVLCSRGEAILEVSMHLRKGRVQLKLPAQQTGSLGHDSSSGHLLKKVPFLSFPIACFWDWTYAAKGGSCAWWSSRQPSC